MRRLATQTTQNPQMKPIVPITIIAALAASTSILCGANPPGPVGHFEAVGRFKPSGAVESVTATQGGRLLIYTNPEDGEVGFVDISDPAAPTEPYSPLVLGGIPTSVACVHARWAIAVVDQGYDPLTNTYA